MLQVSTRGQFWVQTASGMGRIQRVTFTATILTMRVRFTFPVRQGARSLSRKNISQSMYGELWGGDMTKQIGDELFAIEFELNPFSGDCAFDEWLWGRMRFIVSGVPIGDIEHVVSVDSGTVEIARLLANRARRSNPELIQMPTEDLFRKVYSALTEDKGQSDTQVAEDWATYSPLLAVPRFESFDNWDAFLVEDTNRARYVWRDRSELTPKVYEKALRPGQFDDTLEAFLDEMRRLAPDIIKVK